MKRILSITALMIVGFGGVEAWGTDWQFYGANANGRYYYDAESITRPSAGVVRVSEKAIYTEKGLIDMVGVAGEDFKTLSYSVNWDEFHCPKKKWRLLSSVAYSVDGSVLLSGSYGESEWDSIVPESVFAIFYNILCK